MSNFNLRAVLNDIRLYNIGTQMKSAVITIADMNLLQSRMAREHLPAAVQRITELTDENEALRAALERSVVAIDDWLNLSNPEPCGTERVREAGTRLWGHGGTIAYIANVQEQNRKALGRESK